MSSRKAIKFKIQISKPNHTAQRTAIQIGTITRSFIMNFLRLTDELRRKEDAIRFLQQRRILHERRMCTNGHPMALRLSDREDRWRCKVRECREQKQLKAGTWLQGAHLDYRAAALFM